MTLHYKTLTALILVGALSVANADQINSGAGASTHGYFSGPLTEVTPMKGQAATTAASRQLPAPGTLNFKGQLGGAPTASVGPGRNLNAGNLPPVVDATNSIVLNQVANDSAAPTAAPMHVDSAAATNGSTTTAATTSDASPAVSGSLEQRVTRLEQQMKNLTRMNLPQQIDNLQTQLQQLNGQLQVQEHDIKLLGIQQRSFYQDLDQRIKQLSSGNGVNGSASAPVLHDMKVTSVALRESNAYKAGFDLLLKQKYEKAKTQLLKYVDTYPNGQFVVNAHYWLGEIYLIQHNYDSAKTQFNTVIVTAPKSARVPDARFKIATIHLQQGDSKSALLEFKMIKKKYPNSTAAQLATIQIKQLSLQ